MMPLEPNELFPEVANLYEFPSVHCDMIQDARRVNAYRRAIDRVVRSGDVIVDIGTGTGLLAFLALKAGAERIHAIERSSVIEYARELAVANEFDDRIIFHNADSRDTDIGERVDVMLSELIGHIAFEEGMVETLFDARKRFLKPGGRMVPQGVTLFAAPVFEREVYSTTIDPWISIHGIDYSPMRKHALQTSYLTNISERNLLADYLPIFSVDFVQGGHPSQHSDRTFVVHRADTVNGIALWFDAKLASGVTLSSGPWAKTHWLQCFTPIPEPIKVNPGDRLDVSFDMSFRSRANDTFRFSVNVEKRMQDASPHEENDLSNLVSENCSSR